MICVKCGLAEFGDSRRTEEYCTCEPEPRREKVILIMTDKPQAPGRQWWINFCECEPTRTEFPNTVQVATRNVWDANPLFPDAIIHVIEFAEYERVLEENERLKRELANSKRS